MSAGSESETEDLVGRALKLSHLVIDNDSDAEEEDFDADEFESPDENALMSSSEEEELDQYEAAQNNNNRQKRNMRTTNNDDDDDEEEEEEEEEDHNIMEDDFVKGLSKKLEMTIPREDEENYSDAVDSDSNYEDSDETADSDLDIDSDSYRDTLKEAAGIGKKKKGGARRKRGGYQKVMKNLNPEVRVKLSEANEAFVEDKIDVAEKLYMEVLALDAANYAALKTLGEIAKMRGKLSHCCVYWIIAAQIHPWDGEFWAMVGEISASLGHYRQAFYCYTKAVKHDTKDHKYLWERTRLYEEQNQISKALLGYQKILSFDPCNQQLVIEIAKLYSELNRVSEAIEMYIGILNMNIGYYALDDYNREPSMKNFPDFEWSELNILAELYYKSGQYQNGLITIKQTARWLQNRNDETFWDKLQNDSEFDARRFENPEFRKISADKQQRPYELPIDIKIKLGLFRLRCNNPKEASIHFEALLSENDIEEFQDLYTQVATSLEEAGQFGEALKYFIPLSLKEDLGSLEIMCSIGKCFQEVGEYSQAAEIYKDVLLADPLNISIKLALAETFYHLGFLDESLKLSKEVKLLSKKQRNIAPNTISITTSTTTSTTESSELDLTPIPETDEDNTALFANFQRKPTRKRVKKPQLSEGEKEDMKRKIISDTMVKYKRLKSFEDSVNKGDHVGISMWLQIASDLIEIFCGVKALFIREKHRHDAEVLYIHKKNLKMDIGRRLERLTELHELANSSYNQIDPSFTLTDDEYRGLTFDQWFDIFMKYSLLEAKHGDKQDAVQSIEIARNVSAFRENYRRDNTLRFVKLSVDAIIEDYESIMASLRDLLNTHRFSRDSFKLFSLSLPSGRKASEIFISLNHQKYFLRQVKAWDGMRFGRDIDGMSLVERENINFDISSTNPYLVTVYAQVLLSGRSYLSSLFYLSKAYNEFKRDPMICLLLGVACAHRAMQRSSGNRHMFILQAMTYFNEYRDLRRTKGKHEAQEADFNLGRFFHQINLNSIAVQYYEKVLTDYDDMDEVYDLKRESAYNLYLLYNVNGNSLLAHQIMEKYLTI
ncbi:transcription factor TFIIIC subunit [Saccharomycopsis crataegensis]|uniref:Transcription factor TFIIIC subunit n=1 Tax=Saccharomycopsis crataegensis TaxID=43959 RepID=A0AAV5QQ55_9ASCO|nr:transcription factor TFIIIC subunit [Saccharomycopsis crataegensis]